MKYVIQDKSEDSEFWDERHDTFSNLESAINSVGDSIEAQIVVIPSGDIVWNSSEEDNLIRLLKQVAVGRANDSEVSHFDTCEWKAAQALESRDKEIARLHKITKWKPLSTDCAKREQALDIISQYGGIDGEYHKQWVLDQIVRVLAVDYDDWVRIQKAGEDGLETYEWDEGIES